MSIDYKYKPDKHKYRVNIKTIDEMHKEYLDVFKKNQCTIPEKKEKLKKMTDELNELEKQLLGKPINLDVTNLKKRNNLKNSIKILDEEIKMANNYRAEIDYYSRTGEVVYDYYDLTNGMLYNKKFSENSDNNSDNTVANNDVNDNEDNKDTTQQKNGTKIAISDELLSITNLNRKIKIKRPVKKRNKKVDIEPDRKIMSYLIKKEDNIIDKEEIENANKLCRATLQDEYLLIMDKEYACSKSKSNIIKKCKECGIDKIIVYNDSIIACPKCGDSDYIFIESDVPSQRDTFTEKPKYPYKRIGHCIEKLNQFLCKGTTIIPHEVYDVLNSEISKHGMKRSDITVSFLESMLKKHRLSSYYEHVMLIYGKMTNTPPPTITREEYDLVLKMFNEADVAYENKFKPKTRDNFLKYTFVLNKIFYTIGKKDIAKHFKLLKSSIKMKEQERIWRQVCSDLGWEYCGS
jgi:hypothetical protein